MNNKQFYWYCLVGPMPTLSDGQCRSLRTSVIKQFDQINETLPFNIWSGLRVVENHDARKTMVHVVRQEIEATQKKIAELEDSLIFLKSIHGRRITHE